MTSRLLTPAEVQAEYRFGRDHVRRLIRERKVAVVPAGARKVLITRDSLDAYCKSVMVPARRVFLKSRADHA